MVEFAGSVMDGKREVERKRMKIWKEDLDLVALLVFVMLQYHAIPMRMEVLLVSEGLESVALLVFVWSIPVSMAARIMLKLQHFVLVQIDNFFDSPSNVVQAQVLKLLIAALQRYKYGYIVAESSCVLCRNDVVEKL